MEFALIKNNAVQNVIVADQDHADSIAHEWDAVVPANGMGIGWSYVNGIGTAPAQPEAIAPAQPQHATKRAFQNRFPKLANGMSTKWDAMCLFLSDDGYATSLGATGSALFGLRMLITTGVQRLNASPFVDMGPNGEAAAMTGLLTNPAIPADFRLTDADRTAMMGTPLADSERYKG